MSEIGRDSIRPGVVLGTVAILIATALEARAEPSVSGPPMSLLWLIVAGGAVAFALIPHFVRKMTRSTRPKWVFWVASGILVLVFLLFLAPLIVAFGGIMLTGRTM